MMAFILASASPRRRELLNMIGFSDFIVLPHSCNESIPDLPPAPAVESIALLKAKSAAPLCTPSDIILAADTLVFLDGSPLGKPNDPDDAARMLSLLSGKTHSVFTGLALLRGHDILTASEATLVSFRPLSDRDIADYISSGEPLDKAGAYAAQGRGALFISKIAGDFFNVVGLPLCRLSLMLREFGVLL